MVYDDVLIIGSGASALQLAKHIDEQKNVRILTKLKIKDANSYLAQGGIAAAIGDGDNPDKHIQDTMEAGRFHNDQAEVEKVIREAPALIHDLVQQGCGLDQDLNGNLLLGMEGAHSEKRIVHGGGDATGRTLVEFLLDNLTENIVIQEEAFVFELLVDRERNRCIGAKAKRPDGTISCYYAAHIIVATGGCGQLYKFSSNAKTVTGDGIAMAYLAGAEITDMEFVQFHPTLLYVNGETKGLISEAVRGEGAVLITDEGIPIMEGVHPLKDLAPRHVVSQTIYSHINNGSQVYLDVSKITKFEQKFPSITSLCHSNGIDPLKGRIPVVPGSHFLMGGIKTDIIGQTSISGLYAIGEAACTGLHGANRLASNSLLEGLYQGKNLAKYINSSTSMGQIPVQKERSGLFKNTNPLLPGIEEIQNRMMDYTGIVRTGPQLVQHLDWISHFNAASLGVLDLFSAEQLTRIFMCITAELITRAALSRAESRGGHFRSDYPSEDDEFWYQKQITHQYKGEMCREQIKTAAAT